ncbi:hypothetical protein Q5P01_010874 [Channa striata]|uniref:Uncharacterized protein n=1 Tax=Channa striata TaxID=64152 RepID=A0AA88MSD5_CHASR|nr:hypothetical protein Q5P01_010874 [Channa striata]
MIIANMVHSRMHYRRYFQDRIKQVEKQGPGGQGLCTPSTGKGHREGLVGTLGDDREVRRPLRCGGVEPVEPLLKHSSAFTPTLRKGQGSPSANWY